MMILQRLRAASQSLFRRRDHQEHLTFGSEQPPSEYLDVSAADGYQSTANA